MGFINESYVLVPFIGVNDAYSIFSDNFMALLCKNIIQHDPFKKKKLIPVSLKQAIINPAVASNVETIIIPAIYFHTYKDKYGDNETHLVETFQQIQKINFREFHNLVLVLVVQWLDTIVSDNRHLDYNISSFDYLLDLEFLWTQNIENKLSVADGGVSKINLKKLGTFIDRDAIARMNRDVHIVCATALSSICLESVAEALRHDLIRQFTIALPINLSTEDAKILNEICLMRNVEVMPSIRSTWSVSSKEIASFVDKIVCDIKGYLCHDEFCIMWRKKCDPFSISRHNTISNNKTIAKTKHAKLKEIAVSLLRRSFSSNLSSFKMKSAKRKGARDQNSIYASKQLRTEDDFSMFSGSVSFM